MGKVLDKTMINDKAQSVPLPDFEVLSHNIARFVEEAGKATAAYVKPLEEGKGASNFAEEASELVKTIGYVAERWLIDPHKALEAQRRIGTQFLDLWSSTLKRMQGEETEPVAAPEPKDSRFSAQEWSQSPVFDFLKQAYLITSRWAEDMVDEADGIDDHTRQKARFYVKQISSALSPSNFVATNPELLRETLNNNGENLVRGMRMLAEDIQAGHGELKIRQSDPTKFKIGINLAMTPGKVVYRNKIIELIQYSPSTPKAFQIPLLIIPPWINKYYILDLTPEKSYIKWCVDQGLTVFCISWVNPDQRHASLDFEDYMRLGILEALDAIKLATGEEKTNVIGYCVGGTLLSMAMAYMAEMGDEKVNSATLLTTQVDFVHSGDLKVFIDEAQVRAIEHMMHGKGYLDGIRMASAFNMLRPNDLIWPYIVNVYLKGNAPYPFDLLHWNSDSTRMPAANHSFYLRKCYLENALAMGDLEFGGIRLDLKNVKLPIYSLATREDHIAPARSVFEGAKLFGAPVEFVLSGSGHIAGVVNPPARQKYQFWTGKVGTATWEDWLSKATETPGSWWPHWLSWITKHSGPQVNAREPGNSRLKPLCDAPGTYVLEQA